MHTAPVNPVLEPFRHLLAPSGRYPQQHVMILWNTHPAVTEVEVVFIPRPLMPDREDSDLWDQFGGYIRDWDCSLGNCSSDWLTPSGLTPAYVFGRLLERGFVSRQAMINALDEFAQI